jgi:hypothetical protein
MVLSAVCALGQTAQPPQRPEQASASTSAPAIDVQLSTTLAQLERAAQEANAALGRLRIDKWRTDSAMKQRSLSNANSLQRNLSYAVPELTGKIRQAPQDLNANFKLYRNLNALYDVLANVAESAGAFGPQDQYESLARPIADIDQVRHTLGDRLDQMTASKEAELIRLQGQLQANRSQATAPAPKKIVVDDNEAAPKPKKPKAKKPATTQPQTPSQTTQSSPQH